MPSCEHPGGERHCPNHGPAWADRAAAELESIARLVGWNPSETVAEATAERLDEIKRLRETLDAVAEVLARGIPDDRKLTTINRLVHS